MYIINRIPHGKCFVRYLRTRCFCIRNLTRSLRSLVRFLIRQQLVCKYRTPALFMKYSLYIPLILSLHPEYSYWDENLPFSSLSSETNRHPLLSHTVCVPFPSIVIYLWGLNLYQVTFYQRVFLWNLIEFSPDHGDIPIFSFSYLTHAITCYIARSLTLTNGYGGFLSLFLSQ